MAYSSKAHGANFACEIHESDSFAAFQHKPKSTSVADRSAKRLVGILTEHIFGTFYEENSENRKSRKNFSV